MRIHRTRAPILTALLLAGALAAGDPARCEPDVSTGGSPTAAKGDAPAPGTAVAAFERLKSLEGEWIGESTKGWKDRVTFRTIAGGSAVVEISDFEAHPGQTMMTLFHLDGPRLMLTHYCVAGNQPRMVASAISPSGGSLEFTFLDGTSLPSRDHGHMDRAQFAFDGPDRFTARWSWYEKGREQWMEEIRFERKR